MLSLKGPDMVTVLSAATVDVTVGAFVTVDATVGAFVVTVWRRRADPRWPAMTYDDLR
ncbi:MAG: hypothetical protein OXU62_04415 [Gammaproteobacteria bacterium]|nr:hypothetical protein [Gammaproteobacteria bacterium]